MQVNLPQMSSPMTSPPTIVSAMPGDVTSKLALEIAAELSPAHEVIQRYGLSTSEFALVASTPKFRQLYKEARAYWGSDSNAKERIQAKATMLVEDSMLEMFAIIHNKTLAPAARIDSFKTLSKMARTSGDAKDEGAAVGSQFSITIDLGGSNADNQKIVVEAPLDEDEGRDD